MSANYQLCLFPQWDEFCIVYYMLYFFVKETSQDLQTHSLI